MISSILAMVLAGAPAADCPKIDVRGYGKPGGGWFIVTVDPLPTANYTTNWAISNGTITSGQGKAKIDIEAPPASFVTATVEIGGLAKDCPAFASETIDIPGDATCPVLGVDAGLTPDKKTIFRATADPIPSGDFTFNWSVSAGEITDGQGTGNILVAAPNGTAVTATMEVGGLDPSCNNNASATTQIGAE